MNPDYIKPQTGGMIGDIHVTRDGKPDLRFKENRNRPQEEILQEWAQTVYDTYGPPAAKRGK